MPGYPLPVQTLFLRLSARRVSRSRTQHLACARAHGRASAPVAPDSGLAPPVPSAWNVLSMCSRHVGRAPSLETPALSRGLSPEAGAPCLLPLTAFSPPPGRDTGW